VLVARMDADLLVSPRLDAVITLERAKKVTTWSHMRE
jgi:hypothetical protein